MGNTLVCIAPPTASEEAREVVLVNNNPRKPDYTKNNIDKSCNFNAYNNNQCITVVDCVEGQVNDMAPLQVAELMLEHTGCFVVHLEEDQGCAAIGSSSPTGFPGTFTWLSPCIGSTNE